MSTHVPGPWYYNRLNWRNEPQDRDWYIHGDVQKDEDGTSTVSVCVVQGNATSHPVCEDTARLIAAAPDLLAACRELVKMCRRLGFDTPSMPGFEKTAYEMGKAAIHKATGEKKP